jgi:type I restriction enzyme S subunit
MTDHTKTVRLSDVAQVISGTSPSGRDINDRGEGLPFYQGAKEFGTRHPRPERFTTAPVKTAAVGDILLSVRAPVGRVNIADTDCAIGRGVMAVRPRDPADGQYIAAFLQMMGEAWDAHATDGTMFANLSKVGLEQLTVRWPLLRHKIAAVLGALDDRIESCVLIARSCEHLLLAHFDRLQEQGDDTWTAAVMRDVTRFVGGSTPSTSAPEYWSPESHLWATPRDLSRLSTPVVVDTERKISSQGRDQISSRLLPAGSVLLSSRAPIGYLAWLAEPAAINQGIIGFPPGGALSPSFMYAWCKRFMDDIEGRAGGTTFAEISRTNFGTMPVLVPDEEALRRFDRTCAALTETMERESRELQSLHRMRSFLLPRLVSGELRVAPAEKIVEAAT